MLEMDLQKCHAVPLPLPRESLSSSGSREGGEYLIIGNGVVLMKIDVPCQTNRRITCVKQSPQGRRLIMPIPSEARPIRTNMANTTRHALVQRMVLASKSDVGPLARSSIRNH